MLEMRDMYMEEDVYQLQELRQQLEQVQLWVDRLNESTLIESVLLFSVISWFGTFNV